MMQIEDFDTLEFSLKNELSDLKTAESYLRSIAKYPGDRGSDFLPQDALWIKGVRKLYEHLSDADKALLDSYSSDEHLPDSYRKDREQRIKKLAVVLLIYAGKQSPFTIVLPNGVSEYT